MKTSNSLYSPVVILIVTVLLVSCMHKAETVAIPANPLEGTWKGTTWQNEPITLTVAYIDTGLFITKYDFFVKNDSSASDTILHLVRSSSNGMAPVGKDTSFNVPVANIDPSFEYVKGKFNVSKLTFSGSINVVFKPNFDVITGDYNGTKQ
jgi:hypothetical protein